jgi:hypothetical protein
MAVYTNKKKYKEIVFEQESEFEEVIFKNSATLFGNSSILVNIKRKIDSGELGRAVPDGFLFNFSDINNPKFYIVEVELASHDFYKHIFPQITKFFSFIKSDSADQTKLIDTLYRVIEQDHSLRRKFDVFLQAKELFKFLKDVIENSGEILLLIDREKIEIKSIVQTYKDTWGKYVSLIICKVFEHDKDHLIYCDRDLDEEESDLEISPTEDSEERESIYTEDVHLSDTTDLVKKIYLYVKEAFPKVIFNPQKYYISMRVKHNFAFIILRKKIIKMRVMKSYKEARKTVKSFNVTDPGIAVHKFYNGKCCDIAIDQNKHLNEIIKLLKIAEKSKIDRVR